MHGMTRNLLGLVLALAVVVGGAGCATTPAGKIVQSATAIDAIVMPAARAWAAYVAEGFATPDQIAKGEKVYNAYVKAFEFAQGVTRKLRAGQATAAEADAANAAVAETGTAVLDLVKLTLPAPRQADLKLTLEE